MELFDCNLGIKVRAVNVKVSSKLFLRFLQKEIIEKIKFKKKSFFARATGAKQVWGYDGRPPLCKKMFGKSEEKGEI